MKVFFAGKLDSGQFAVRLSRNGYDALTEQDLGSFLIHENLDTISPLISGQLLVDGNSFGVVDTFVPNIIAPPLVFFFAQRRFVPEDYIQMGKSLYCRNEDAYDFQKIRFINGKGFQVIVSYFVYNRRLGV